MASDQASWTLSSGGKPQCLSRGWLIAVGVVGDGYLEDLLVPLLELQGKSIGSELGRCCPSSQYAQFSF